jgi:hypothetical protein
MAFTFKIENTNLTPLTTPPSIANVLSVSAPYRNPGIVARTCALLSSAKSGSSVVNNCYVCTAPGVWVPATII